MNFLIDLDGTLLDFYSAEKKAIKRIVDLILKRNNIQRKKVIEGLNEIRKKYSQLTGKPKDHSREEWFKILKKEYSLNIDPKHLEEVYWKEITDNIKEFRGATKFLLWLKKEHKVVIISDSDGKKRFKMERIKKFGYHKIVDSIVTSDDTGVNKPSPKVFREALRKINGKVKESIIIGDNPFLDLSTPQKMGMTTIWFRKKPAIVREEDIKEEYADYVVKSYKEIISLVKKKMSQ